LNSKYKRLVRV